LETIDFFSYKPLTGNFTEIFTSGRWIILEEFFCMEMKFSDEALNESDYAQASLKTQTVEIQNLKLKQHYMIREISLVMNLREMIVEIFQTTIKYLLRMPTMFGIIPILVSCLSEC
jgi:hypothetical protein